MSLAEFLKEKMGDQKKTPFAKAMDIHPTEITRIFDGKMPSETVLKKLSAGLKISVEDLIDIYNNRSNEFVRSQCGLLHGKCHELMTLSQKINKENPGQKILTPRKIAETLCEQDEERYAPNPKYAGTPQQWEEIFDRYPDTALMFYFIREEDGEKTIEIAGDWSVAFYPAGEVPIDENGVIVEIFFDAVHYEDLEEVVERELNN